MARILVMDDEPDIVELLSEILAIDGFEVNKAYSGEKGLEMLGKNTYDLVIMDMRMMGLSGIDVYKRIVHDYPFLKGRVVFCSGLFDKEMKSFLAKHQVPYLQKPCSVQGIRDVVKNTLRQAGHSRV